MKLSIRTRLLAGLGAMAALIAAYSVFDHLHTNRLVAAMHHQQGKSAHLARAQNALWELRYGFPQFLVLTGPDDRRRIVEAEPAHYATFERGIRDFAASEGLSPQEATAARAVQLAFDRYRAARPRWFDLIASGQMEEAATWRAATTTPYGAATVKAVNELVDISAQQDLRRLEALDAQAHESDLAAGLALMAIALLVSWWVYRGVSRPLDRLQDTIDRVATGDLQARTGMDGSNELASLGASFDRLLDAHLVALDRVQSENDELSRSMQALMEAEQRVQAGEHLMRVMADHMPVRLAYWDADLRCQFVNRRYCELLQVEREQVLGARHDSLVFGREGTLQLDPEHVHAALQGSARRVEQEAREADNRASSWIVHYLPHFAAGEVAGFFTVAQDVTELKGARDAAVAASQAKSRFLSSMSHEIRTPMNAVVGMLDLLQLSGLDSRQRDYTDKAAGAARSLLSLLNDILDFSKIEAGRMQLEPRAFSLDALLADLSTILAGAVGRKQVEVLYDIDARIPDRLVADDMRLRQILINLGGNAVKFTSEGEVVVQLRLLAAAAHGVRLEFAVRDTGIGITPEQCARLFDDYAQAHGEIARSFGGTGLGLSICRRLAAMMGSELKVQSTPGAGSRFSFELELPLAAEEAPVIEQLPIEHVLIVDDNIVARESLRAIAGAQGWRVDTAEGGRQALELLSAPEVRYDAIFIDWNMPGLDGWETSLRIRELQAGKQPQLLLMLTAYGREMLSRRPAAEQALIDGYLVKPVTGSMLETALRDALAGPQRAAAAPVASEAPLAGLKLLLVEDNIVNQQIAFELLTREGAEIDVAGDGREAIARLSGQHRYDVVLMDVLMPVMGGLEATRHIRQQLGLRQLPILAMTANALDNDREECLAAGMDAHIGKPFVLEDLVRTIRQHASRRGPAALPAPAPVPADLQAALPLWDREQAMSVLGGQPELLDRIVRIFGDELRRTIASLRGGLSQQELQRCFHTLKASAGGVGAARLAEAAATADRAARQVPAVAELHVPSLLLVAEQTLGVLA